jgi:hypothetical protein
VRENQIKIAQLIVVKNTLERKNTELERRIKELEQKIKDGIKGEKGDPGPKGDKGEKGDPGVKGDRGEAGSFPPDLEARLRRLEDLKIPFRLVDKDTGKVLAEKDYPLIGSRTERMITITTRVLPKK